MRFLRAYGEGVAEMRVSILFFFFTLFVLCLDGVICRICEGSGVWLLEELGNVIEVIARHSHYCVEVDWLYRT